MLRLRPYKSWDASTIVSWCRDERSFRLWTSDRYDSFPITGNDMNYKYIGHNGDCPDGNNFYPFTAFDENGLVGHLIMRFTDSEMRVLRFGFVIVNDAVRGKGYGKEMIRLALDYAFNILKADKVTIGVFENNTPAYRCYLSSGFTPADAEPSYYSVFGETWKCVELEAVKSI